MVIGICDDDNVFALKLKSMIEEYMQTHCIAAIEIRIYKDQKSLMGDITECNMLFLDIEMEDEDSGIFIKDQIDAYQLDIIVVFVTSHVEMMEQAFGRSVQAFLKKQELESKISSVLDRIILQMNSLNLKMQDIMMCTHEINIRQIRYIEVDGKYTTVHMQDNCYVFRQTLKQWERMLSDASFFVANRHCIVNFAYLKGSLMSGKYRIDDKTIVIARARKSAFKQAYRMYMRGK